MHSRCIQLALFAGSSFLVVLSAGAGLTPTISPPPTPSPLPLNPPILGPSATVVLPTAAYAISRSVNGLFQRVGLSPDQIAQITVQYPAAQALQFVKVEALDGGSVGMSLPSVQPPNTPGGSVQLAPF